MSQILQVQPNLMRPSSLGSTQDNRRVCVGIVPDDTKGRLCGLDRFEIQFVREGLKTTRVTDAILMIWNSSGTCQMKPKRWIVVLVIVSLACRKPFLHSQIRGEYIVDGRRGVHLSVHSIGQPKGKSIGMSLCIGEWFSVHGVWRRPEYSILNSVLINTSEIGWALQWKFTPHSS